MRKRTVKLLKFIAIVFVIVLVIELIYIVHLRQGKSIYFDGINSVINVDDGYVAVGSNNNNDKYFEKAKITKYNVEKEKRFEKIYNKGLNGVFFDVIEDLDGNLIAVGSFESNEKDHDEGNRVGLIVKYDKDGNLLYDNSFKVLDDSKFTSIDIVDDGYIVTGQSVYDELKVGFSSDGGAFVIKYDKELKLEWSSNYGDTKTAVYNDVLVFDKNIYAVGVANSIVGIISKFDFNGKLLDSFEYEYTDNLGFTGIAYFDDKLLACGAKSENNNKNIDAILLELDFDLKDYKEVIYKEGGFERFNQLAIDEHDNVIVVGTSAKLDKNDSDKSVNIYIHDGLIGKYDKSLEKISVVRYGDDRDDYFTDVIINENNYLVSGYSSYEDGSYLSKFITYSYALKILEVG